MDEQTFCFLLLRGKKKVPLCIRATVHCTDTWLADSKFWNLQTIPPVSKHCINITRCLKIIKNTFGSRRQLFIHYLKKNQGKYTFHSVLRVICIMGEHLFSADFPPSPSFFLQLLVSGGQGEFSCIEKVLTAEWLCQAPVFKETELHITRKWLFSYLFINHLSKRRQTELPLLKLGSNELNVFHKDYVILQTYGEPQTPRWNI